MFKENVDVESPVVLYSQQEETVLYSHDGHKSQEQVEFKEKVRPQMDNT